MMRTMVRDILELGSSLGFLDDISEGFLQQPDAIDPSWKALLTDGHAAGDGNGRAAARAGQVVATNGQAAAANGQAVAANGQAAATNGQVASNGQGAATNGQAARGEPADASGNGHGGGNGRAAQEALALQGLPRDASSARPGIVTMSPIAAQATPTVWPLVNAYRSRGHFNAKLDPLGLLETARIAELDPATWGFTPRDMDRVIEPTGVHGLPRATLAE